MADVCDLYHKYGREPEAKILAVHDSKEPDQRVFSQAGESSVLKKCVSISLWCTDQ